MAVLSMCTQVKQWSSKCKKVTPLHEHDLIRALIHTLFWCTQDSSSVTIQASISSSSSCLLKSITNLLHIYLYDNLHWRQTLCSIFVQSSENFCTQLQTIWRDSQCLSYMDNISLPISFADRLFVQKNRTTEHFPTMVDSCRDAAIL